MSTGNLAPTLFVAALGVVSFAPFFFGGRVLAPLDIVSEMYQPWRGSGEIPRVHNHFVTDTVTNFLPYRLMSHESLRQDGYVGWNPFIFGGTAQHANTMLISHEATQWLHRWLEFWPAWVLGRFLQFLLAGIGMGVFLASRGYGPGISAFGGTAYMLNQQFVAWIYFNQVVAAFCWMPWMLWALFRAREGETRAVAWAVLFLGLALLGATLQQAAFLVAVLGSLWFGWVLEQKNATPSWRRVTWLIFLAGMGGACLAAFTLEPSIQAFLENSQAGHHRGQFFYENGLGQPIFNLLASPLTAYPFLLGSVQSLDLWKLFKLEAFSIGFFGTLPMILAIIGLFSKKVPLSAKILVLVGFLVPLTPLVGYVYHRFNVIWILGGCWSACAWLAKAEEENLKQLFSRFRIPLALLGCLWLLASACLMLARGSLEPWLQEKVLGMASSSNFGFFSAWIQERASRMIDYLCIWNPWQILGLAGLILSLWGLGQIRSRSPIALLAALGVALQLSVFWWQWTTWSLPVLPYGTTPLERLLQAEVGEGGRLALDTSSRSEQFLPLNTLMPSKIPVTNGYDAMHPHGMRSPSGRTWDFPGTTHYLGSVSAPYPGTWEQIWKERDWALWRNPRPIAGNLFLKPGPRSEPLPPSAIRRPTLNTLEVVLPPGTIGVEIFSNWHRNWFWQKAGDKEWRKAGIGPGRNLEIQLPEAVAKETVVGLRYQPRLPQWVAWISAITLTVVLGWAYFGLPRPT